MATLTASKSARWYWTKSDTTKGATPGSDYIGCEGSHYRVMGYSFKTPATGIVNFSFSLYTNSHHNWGTSNNSTTAGDKLKYTITTSNSVPAFGAASLGKVKANNGRIYSDGSITKILSPNTTYYLWIWSGSYYSYAWEVSGQSVTITYDGGVVNLYDGKEWKKAVVWIYDGKQWKNAIPWIYNGKEWKNTC